MRYKAILALLLLPTPATAGQLIRYDILESGIIYRGDLGTQLPCVVQTDDGIIVQFNTGTDFWPGSKAMAIKSNDGHDWGKPYQILNATFTISTNIGITKLRDGTLLLPFSQSRLLPGYSGYPEPKHCGTANATASCARSEDHGKTWKIANASGDIPASAAYGRIVEMPNGVLLMPIWFYNYWGVTFHVGITAQAGFVESYDQGRTWGRFNRISNGGETSILLMPDKTTLLALVKDTSKYPIQQNYYKSTNGGVTWEYIDWYPVPSKNASLHLSPYGIPLIFASPKNSTNDNIIAQMYYSLNDGLNWKPGIRLPDTAYGINAVNLDCETMLIVYSLRDESKEETGDSPWTTTKTYLGYSIVHEFYIPETDIQAENQLRYMRPTQPVIQSKTSSESGKNKSISLRRILHGIVK